MEMIELAGPFGGVTLGQRTREDREDFYELEMKTCLRDRGHRI